eukprot:6996552-Pyramimonas_sp.AAC.1
MHRASQPDAERTALQTTSKAPGAAPKVSGCRCFDVREKDKNPSGSTISSAAPAAVSASAGAPAASASASAGQPAIIPEINEGNMRYWETLGTLQQMVVNPACGANADDGSSRHRVVECPL